jgi:hypothetical protein
MLLTDGVFIAPYAMTGKVLAIKDEQYKVNFSKAVEAKGDSDLQEQLTKPLMVDKDQCLIMKR